jgi:hypothetical protein
MPGYTHKPEHSGKAGRRQTGIDTIVEPPVTTYLSPGYSTAEDFAPDHLHRNIFLRTLPACTLYILQSHTLGNTVLWILPGHQMIVRTSAEYILLRQ